MEALCVMCLLLINPVSGFGLPQCTDGAIELTEGVAGQTITCTGTGSTQQVSWMFDSLGLATCSASSNCRTQFTFVTPTRNDSSSTLTFPGAIIVSRSALGNKTITCTLAGNPPQSRSCTVDVIYAAEKPTCSISSKRDNSELKLIGVCTINKAFSSIGRYDCQWVHRNITGQITLIPEEMTLVTSPVMIPGTGNDPYYSFNCSFEVTLPMEAGPHSYTVLVKPGSVLTTITYDIVLPTAHTNCPTDYVMEGDDVDCMCSSTDGNPAGSAVWRVPSGSSRLVLNDVRRDKHCDSYVCEVKWSSDVVSNVTFSLQVAYEATISSFDANSVTSDSLTVNTSDTVTLTCRGVGRPSPEMTLSSATQDAIGHIPQGTPFLQDKVTAVTGSVTAQCRDTGIYTCEAGNGVGEKQTRRVSVFVRCKPEVLDNRPGDGGRMETPSLNFTTKAVRLNFHFAAYPTPQLSDIKFFPQRPNTTSVGKPVKGNTIKVACSRHPLDLFNVTCAVTVNDITSSDAGFYQAVIGNSLGDEKVLFQVTVNAITKSPGGKQDSSLGVEAAVGVAVAVMVVIVVVFFVWLWRRHWVLPCAAATEREADVRMESRNVEPPQGSERHGQGQPDDYEIQDIEGTTTSEYASLKIDDVGLRSVYSKITPTSTSTRTTVTADTGQVYEDTDMSSRSPYVDASDYKR